MLKNSGYILKQFVTLQKTCHRNYGKLKKNGIVSTVFLFNC